MSAGIPTSTLSSEFHIRFFTTPDSGRWIARATPTNEAATPPKDVYFGSVNGRDFFRLPETPPKTTQASEPPPSFEPVSNPLQEGLLFYFDVTPQQSDEALFEGIFQAHGLDLDLRKNLQGFIAELSRATTLFLPLPEELKTVSTQDDDEIVSKEDVQDALQEMIKLLEELHTLSPATPAFEKGKKTELAQIYSHLSGMEMFSAEKLTFCVQKLVHKLNNSLNAPYIYYTDLHPEAKGATAVESWVFLLKKISTLYRQATLKPGVKLSEIVTQSITDFASASKINQDDASLGVIELDEPILVVEDDPIVARSTVAFLKRSGFRNVLLAHDAVSASDLIRNHKLRFVLSDYNLDASDPKAPTGVDLAADFKGSDVTFFFRSGNVEDLEAALKTSSLGHFGYFSKIDSFRPAVTALQKAVLKKILSEASS